MKKLALVFICLFSSLLFAQVHKTLVLNPALKPFYHGVASGDPLTDKVIIWTRLTPDTNWTGSANVDWKVALDTNMVNVVQSGTFVTDQSRDYTVKVDVSGLAPNTFYFYEFSFNGCYSLRGRTKTAPLGSVDSLRFAVVSCANYEAGYFNAYRVIKERNDIDALIHLGDYIYEYEHDGYAFNTVSNRIWEPMNEILVLNDYRTRYATYHLDEDLLRLHQQFPFFMIWDDHEFANDAYKDGADNHTEGPEGAWINRKAFAKKAYFEWVPIREQVFNNDTVIFRKIEYGDLVDFLMLDTRLHERDEQVAATSPAVNDTGRSILGNDQFDWLKQNLVNSTKQWKVLGQQVMVAPLKAFGVPVNADQWDGYAADRTELISYVLANAINDVVVITGDIHTSWANDVPTATYDASSGSGSAFVEFVTTSVTSPSLPLPVPAAAIKLFNPHVKYCDLTKKGFMLLDVNHARVQADWFYVNTIDASSGGYNYGDSWYVNNNERFLRHSGSVAIPRPGVQQPFAPLAPRPCFNTAVEENDPYINFTSVYPNPTEGELYMQLYLKEDTTIKLELTDLNGKLVKTMEVGPLHSGLCNIVMPMYDIASGSYMLTASVNGHSSVIKVIRK